MRVRRLIWWLAVWLVTGTGLATGQFSIPKLGGADEEGVSVSSWLSLDRLAPGTEFRVALVLDLKGSWHVNAHDVTSKMQIPTVLTWESTSGIEVGKVTYPAGKNLKVGWSDEPLKLYEGRAVMLTRARVLDDAKPGPLTIRGSVRYQACDDHRCLAPVSVPVAVTTEVLPVGSILTPQHAELFALAEPGPVGTVAAVAGGNGEQENMIARRIRESGWLAAYGFLFVGGLLLNLTPCVYPMIAITVGYFGGRNETRRGRAFGMATIYFTGIVLTYSCVGLVAAMTGGLFGGLLQNAAVLVFVALVLAVLSLGMFGLFELQPPRFLMERASGLSAKAGYAGVFFLGATVGVIAAPCIAPVLVALLVYVGQRGDPLLGFSMFLTLAAGLGAPYIVLGTFSGLLARLPKSGMWMVGVKRAMGVVMMGVALWVAKPVWSSWLPAARVTEGKGVQWEAYTDDVLVRTLNAREPVIIDFRADWCGPCLEMEATTFVDERVVKRTADFVMVKADLTDSGSEPVVALRKRYEVVGVPTIVFLDAEGRELKALRQVQKVTADELLRLMDQVRSR